MCYLNPKLCGGGKTLWPSCKLHTNLSLSYFLYQRPCNASSHMLARRQWLPYHTEHSFGEAKANLKKPFYCNHEVRY